MELWDRATALHEQAHKSRDQAERNKLFAEAEVFYDQLLTQNHDNAGLLATLGTLYLQTNRHGMAICLLENSLRGKKNPEALSNLGMAYKNSGQREKAIKCFEESVRIAPTGEVLANYSALFVESGQDERCKTLCKRAIDLSPNHPIAHWNLALALLAEGDWARAWDEYEWGLVDNCMRIDRNLGGVPFWDGAADTKVCVYGEQGIGDEIMFASMLPDMMKTNTVVLECHKRLKTLFEMSFPSLHVHGTREDEMPLWVEGQDFEARLSIGSLGKFYRRSREDFPGTPYLKAEPALPVGDKFRVGISWTGGQKAGRVLKRTIPLSWWKPILNVPNVEFISLQYTECAEEIDLVNALGYDIKQMDEYVKAEDYYETARLVASCDLVISVCTSLVHLAGGLGVPCWVMAPRHPAWRYQNEGGMPWYQSVRLYRQPKADMDSWLPVVERAGMDLAELVDQRRRVAA